MTALAALLAGCGGEGGDGIDIDFPSITSPAPVVYEPVNPPPSNLWRPTPGSTPPSGNYIYLESDSGDWIGQGKTFVYTQAEARFDVFQNSPPKPTSNANISSKSISLNIGSKGFEDWNGRFYVMDHLDQLMPGFYPDLDNLTRHPVGGFDPAKGGLMWNSENRSCLSIKGWFVIDHVDYQNGSLSAVDLRFSQYCDDSRAALKGEIRWRASDTTELSELTLPSSGNYVYLKSSPGDVIGQGYRNVYTQSDHIIINDVQGGQLNIQLNGGEIWFGTFLMPGGATQLQIGEYDNLSRFPSPDPNFDTTAGGFQWFGEHRSCSDINSAVKISNVIYQNGDLTDLDLNFEQFCGGTTDSLHGEIHWTNTDITIPAGPVTPIPGDLWEPDPGSLPSTGNYVFLHSASIPISELGIVRHDYVGQGEDYLYTAQNSMLTVAASQTYLRMDVNGFENWLGQFQTMFHLDELETGYYPDLSGYPFHDPTKGGLSWWGEGRSCSELTGWFVIDNASYQLGDLTELDLRFAQHCEALSVALYGKIHWTAADPTLPSGPVSPPPTGLWEPAPESTPPSGNYVFLKSESGDFIGQGAEYTYTDADATFYINLGSTSPDHFKITVDGNEIWSGDFQTMYQLDRIETGYYPNLMKYARHNPAMGGFTWRGDGRGCNTSSGWSAVDHVSYENGNLTGIDLRFKQHCDDKDPALYGEIHWRQ